MIKINDKIPNIPLYIVKDGQSTPIESHDVLKGKCVLFGIPGAFTKTCSSVQVPSYINNRKVILPVTFLKG
jgi:peroxiredoxin